MQRLDLLIKEMLIANVNLRKPRFGICVIGLPGGRKTLTTLDTLFRKLLRVFTPAYIPVVIAMPTRTLRDWCAKFLVDNYLSSNEVVVYRSKLEFCDVIRHELARQSRRVKICLLQVCRKMKVKPRIFTRDLLEFLIYMYALFKTCRECQNRPNCEFYQNYRLLLSGGFKVFLMTHKLLQILLFADPTHTPFRHAVVVIDEADSYLDLFQNFLSPVHLAVLQRLAKWDSTWSKIYRAIVQQLVRFGEGLIFFLKPTFPRCLLPICISATIELYFLQTITAMSGLDTVFRVVAIPSRMMDRCVTCVNLIYAIDVFKKATAPVVKPQEAVNKIGEVIIRLVDDYKLSIGVAARSYEFNRMLSQYLAQVGMRFYTDLFYSTSVDVKKLREALEKVDVVIWTTGGKLYRGVSLPDKDVIICTYQAAPLVQPSGHVLTYVPKFVIDLDTQYAAKVNDARNVQSYFRANRKRDMRHIFVFADLRSWLAMREVLQIYAQKSTEFRKWYNQELLGAKEVDLRDVKTIVDTVASQIK